MDSNNNSTAQSNWWYLRFKENKSRDNSGKFETNVVGVTFENRQAIIAQLSINEQLWLRREPQNPHDKNAISVWRDNDEQIGYISRDLAINFAPAFDKIGVPIPAVVTAVLGKNYSDSKLGVQIKFVVPEMTSLQPISITDDFSDHEDF